MCGIVGYIQTDSSLDKDKKYLKVFSELLVTDSVRGVDSTGVAVIPIDKTKHMRIEKLALPGFDFVQTKEYGKASKYMEEHPSLVIGHNRAATNGAITDYNAHPFRYDDITLVHNGVIRNFRQLNSGTTSDVDSAHVCASIAKHGYAHTLKEMDGYAILVWHDASDHTVHFARTNNRSLCWMFDEFGTLWYASEHKMLEWVCHRNNLNLVGKLMAPREHYHYWAPLANIKNFTKESFPEYVHPNQRSSVIRLPHDSEFDKWKNRNGGGGSTLGESRGQSEHPPDGVQSQSVPTCLTSSKGSQQGTTSCGSTDRPTTTTRNPLSNNSTAGLYYCSEVDSVKEGLESNPARYEPRSERKINRLQRHLSRYNLRLGELIDVVPYGFKHEKSTERVTVNAVFQVPIDHTKPNAKRPLEVKIYDTTEGYFYRRDPYGRLRVRVASIIDIIDPAKPGGSYECLVCAPAPMLLSETCVGPGGIRIPKDVFTEIADKNCYHCQGKVMIADQHDISWDGTSAEPRVVCPSCTHQMQAILNR